MGIASVIAVIGGFATRKFCLFWASCFSSEESKSQRKSPFQRGMSWHVLIGLGRFRYRLCRLV
jgi:hypothetical protein